jgi:hypothetical protein
MISKRVAVLRRILSRRLVWLDYPFTPRPRWGDGRPPHKELYALLDLRRANYEQMLLKIVEFSDRLAQIPLDPDPASSQEPYWDNGWLMGIDAACLYSMVASKRPRRFYEVGSGHSTRFARRAIRDLGLECEILSIDPQPRSEIDGLCDRIVREPLESVNLDMFSRLEAGDFLFVDSSHYSFSNSDVTTIFLEVLPKLKPGVWIHFHDIWLPSDYPDRWALRFYNEQYLLGVLLLSNPDAIEVGLSSRFVVDDPVLREILEPLWDRLGIANIQRRTGGSFWYRKAI